MRRLALWFAVLGLVPLTACDTIPDWFGAGEDPPLPGQRISVLQLEQDIEPDPSIADLEVKLPAPWRNPEWPQAEGYANHAMHHLALGDALRTVWRRDIGDGSSSDTRLLSRPVVGEGRIFTLDAESNVSAFEADTGKPLWRLDLTPEHEDSGALGGGLALSGGRLFATTGYGEVFALEAASGAVVWKRELGTPIRVPPAVAEGRIFTISYDNRMTALAADDGRELWTHEGIAEDAGLIGGAMPAVEGGIVVAPYSSGQLFGLRVENGRVVWQDQLVRIARFTPLATLSEIRGSPVIDRGLVYAISHSGRMVAIDLRSGDRIWERDIEGVETPWVAGDFIFLVTTQAEVICLSRRDGRVRWVTQLQRFEDEKDREDPIRWVGPVLAGDRLLLLSSHRRAVTLSPYTGQLLGEIKLSEAALVAPVVADGTLFILTDDAELSALR
jgi:outer membrane protein assembly factor BamB